jgi:hypothetical protein
VMRSWSWSTTSTSSKIQPRLSDLPALILKLLPLRDGKKQPSLWLYCRDVGEIKLVVGILLASGTCIKRYWYNGINCACVYFHCVWLLPLRIWEFLRVQHINRTDKHEKNLKPVCLPQTDYNMKEFWEVFICHAHLSDVDGRSLLPSSDEELALPSTSLA